MKNYCFFYLAFNMYVWIKKLGCKKQTNNGFRIFKQFDIEWNVYN